MNVYPSNFNHYYCQNINVHSGTAQFQVSAMYDNLLPTYFLDIINSGRLLIQYINP